MPVKKRQKLQKSSIIYEYHMKKKQSQLALIKEDLTCANNNSFNKIILSHKENMYPSTSSSHEGLANVSNPQKSSFDNNHEICSLGNGQGDVVVPLRKKGLFLSGTSQSASGVIVFNFFNYKNILSYTKSNQYKLSY